MIWSQKTHSCKPVIYLLKSVILMKEKTWVTSLRMKKDGTWTCKILGKKRWGKIGQSKSTTEKL